MFRDDYIYRLLTPENWAASQQRGEVAYAPVDDADGFFHLSTAAQVLETARLHYADHPHLCAVGVLPDRLGEALRWEPSRGGDLFPHLYGTLSVRDISHLVFLEKGEDGLFSSVSEEGVS